VSDLVWYAAFGSNLSGARFSAYLTGGPVAHRTDGGRQDGARDPSPPRRDRRFELAHRLFFAGSSRGWGSGGIAFIDPVPDREARCLSRLWLITAEQFADVARQENGLDALPPIDLDRLEAAGHLDVASGWYGRVLHLGLGPGGRPIVTVTCDRADRRPFRPAHRSYLRVVGLGLMETWGLTPQRAASYLAGQPGNAGLVDTGELAADLASLDPAARASSGPKEAP
jgi:hypothetical protein